MVGGGNRRDEGSFTVSSTNVFAALDTLRKKKRSDKEKGTSKGGKSSSKAGKSKAAEEKLVYWAPAPLTVKSWADVDDEDDDDYYATTAPPQAIWGTSGLSKAKETQKPAPVEESESEDDLLDEGDDDVEEEGDHETEVQEQAEPEVRKPVEVSQAPKETDRQLSKKERKKKELAELDAILADFGVNPKEKTENEPSVISKEEGQLNGDAEKKDVAAPTESKTARKKKKKDKASKESKESQEQPKSSDAQEENAEGAEVATAPFKKVVPSLKKKKSTKEMDAAARAAALEAAARSAKLAAAKKKEKNHYNQQPMR